MVRQRSQVPYNGFSYLETHKYMVYTGEGTKKDTGIARGEESGIRVFGVAWRPQSILGPVLEPQRHHQPRLESQNCLLWGQSNLGITPRTFSTVHLPARTRLGLAVVLTSKVNAKKVPIYPGLG